MLEAARLSMCGQRFSVICSRWRRWFGASARSLIRAAARLSRHSSCPMVRDPTPIEKRRASLPGEPLVYDPPLPPLSSNDNNGGRSRLPSGEARSTDGVDSFLRFVGNPVAGPGSADGTRLRLVKALAARHAGRWIRRGDNAFPAALFPGRRFWPNLGWTRCDRRRR